VVQTGREGGYHEDLRTDFPLGPDCPPDLVAWSQPLAALYLDRFRAGAAIPAEDDRIFDVFGDLRTALYLLPPTEWTVLREMLGSPHQYVRFTALPSRRCTVRPPWSRRCSPMWMFDARQLPARESTAPGHRCSGPASRGRWLDIPCPAPVAFPRVPRRRLRLSANERPGYAPRGERAV
jgi:hypothetical protein